MTSGASIFESWASMKRTFVGHSSTSRYWRGNTHSWSRRAPSRCLARDQGMNSGSCSSMEWWSTPARKDGWTQPDGFRLTSCGLEQRLTIHRLDVLEVAGPQKKKSMRSEE